MKKFIVMMIVAMMLVSAGCSAPLQSFGPTMKNTVVQMGAGLAAAYVFAKNPKSAVAMSKILPAVINGVSVSDLITAEQITDFILERVDMSKLSPAETAAVSPFLDQFKLILPAFIDTETKWYVFDAESASGILGAIQRQALLVAG